jgi:hypothetical protein
MGRQPMIDDGISKLIEEASDRLLRLLRHLPPNIQGVVLAHTMATFIVRHARPEVYNELITEHAVAVADMATELLADCQPPSSESRQ